MRRPHGFTMVELMVAVAIMAILLTIAVPSFSNATLGSQLRASATEFIASANLARSEAIKRNVPVRLCASSDAATCTGGAWEQGWIVVTTEATPILLGVQSALGQSLHARATGGLGTVTFEPTGTRATVAEITFCRANPVGPQERVINIDAAGRATARKTSAGVCP